MSCAMEQQLEKSLNKNHGHSQSMLSALKKCPILFLFHCQHCKAWRILYDFVLLIMSGKILRLKN